ncbi:MAG: response regulator [Clostridiales bacterium]|jgi:signal transduction histidine kinase|nr:response regulator [Clostridiales bacterium]
MRKWLKNAGFATKMTAAFAVIAAIFSAGMLYSNWSSAEIDRMHRHNLDFVVARTEYVLDFFQAHTELRRLSRETIMNPYWRDFADIEARLEAENTLRESQGYLASIANLYMRSILNDENFTGYEAEVRISLMTDTMSLINLIFHIFEDNFVVDSDESFDAENALELVAQSAENIDQMRALAAADREEAVLFIGQSREQGEAIAIGIVIAAIFVAAGLGYWLINVYRSSIRAVENRVALIAVGEFEAATHADDGSNELADIFSNVTSVFSALIDQINFVAHQVKSDDKEARLDIAMFGGGYREAAFAVNSLIDSLFEQQDEVERMMFMFDHMPIITIFFDKNMKILDASKEVERKFLVDNKSEFIENFLGFSPEYQPDGSLSKERAVSNIKEAFEKGFMNFEWTHMDSLGRLIPTEVVGMATRYKGEPVLVTYSRDISAIKESQAREAEAAERIKIMFEATPMIIEFWNTNFKCIDSNPYALAVFGFESKEEYESKVFDIMVGEQPCGTPSVEFWRRKLTKILEDGYTTFRFVYRRFDGHSVYTDVVGVRMVLGGEIVLATYSNDITQLIQSQSEARAAMERTQLMFNATPMLIEFWNRNNEMIDYNPFAIKLFGLERPDEYQKRYDEFFPRLQPCGTPSWTFWVRQLKAAFEKGHHSYKLLLKSSSGEDIYTEGVAIRMIMGEEDVVVSYSNDVTVVKESMDMIKAAEERTKLMLDGNPVACYLINRGFNIIDCNREAVSLFNFKSREEAMEKSRDIFMHRNLSELLRQFEAAFNDGFREFEWELENSDGLVIPCRISFVRVSLDDEDILAAYVMDMTAIKKMIEHQEQVQIAEANTQAKSKFLASMSHEIRTPITAVLGIAEIQMQNRDLPMDVEEAFNKIYDSGNILLGIINDILDISKIEAGKMDLIFNPYEVASLAIDIIQMHLVHLGSKRIKFIVDIDEDIPMMLLGDELRIKQIMNNVLSNAFKYTDAGTVTLKMHCEFLEGREDVGAPVKLHVSIIDTGKGMSEQQLAALQDEYTRFHEKEDRFTQGTGLGMPIVYNLTELMGGEINVESHVGLGTSVTMILPQEISDAEKLGLETVENLSRFESGVLSSGKKMNFVPEPMPYGRVLVVDDVETNIYVAKGLLGFYGLQIDSVDGGYPAIEKVKSGEVYDIIFMDHMMPDINGLEATKIIRGLGYTAPIVALTANALIGQAEEFMRNGFDGFVSKPIQTMHLDNALNKFIRDKQPPEVLEAARAKQKGGDDSVQNNEMMSIDDYYSSSGMSETLRKEFLRTQKNIMAEIFAAVEENDLETAHRLAHTLKGLAGLINEKGLIALSQKCENNFKQGQIPTPELLETLAEETQRVLDDIAEQFKDELGLELSWDDVDMDEARELLDKIQGLLEADSTEVMDLADDLRKIPGAMEIVDQIENFDFEDALSGLKILREEAEL